MIKNIIPLLGLSLLNPAFAESTAYDTATNIMTIPFVQLNNHNFSNVRFICDPANGYSCKLMGGDTSDCASGIYNREGSSKNLYYIHTRSSGGIQYGGLQLGNPDGSEFMVSWIKSPKEQNPYLVGHDLSQFFDNVAYGVVGKSEISGFKLGDLITVVGDSTGYSIEKINGDDAVAFNEGLKINVNNNCNSLTGEYIGNIGYAYGLNNTYNVNILNKTDGNIQLSNTEALSFTASWDGSEKLLNNYSLASLGNIQSNAYPGFTGQEDKAFVTDIGDGIALTVVDALTGRVKSTATFILKQ